MVSRKADTKIRYLLVNQHRCLVDASHSYNYQARQNHAWFFFIYCYPKYLKTIFSVSYEETITQFCHPDLHAVFFFSNTLFNASLCLLGSEWRYVIISTVCSLPSDQIEEEPDGAFFSKHLGFVGDANQINVAITRAKEGLCIIGECLQLIVRVLLTSVSNVPVISQETKSCSTSTKLGEAFWSITFLSRPWQMRTTFQFSEPDSGATSSFFSTLNAAVTVREDEWLDLLPCQQQIFLYLENIFSNFWCLMV